MLREYIIAKRMHGMQLPPGEPIPTWFVYCDEPETYTVDKSKAQTMTLAEAQRFILARGSVHYWIASINGQAFAMDGHGYLSASIPLEQLP